MSDKKDKKTAPKKAKAAAKPKAEVKPKAEAKPKPKADKPTDFVALRAKYQSDLKALKSNRADATSLNALKAAYLKDIASL
tara:strand:- start:1302 stop:1544 length:243 start_codon:yes stop_codon:yes gene_type:complete